MFVLVGVAANSKPCKGMAGLLEEGEEVRADGEAQEDAPADPALIAASQKVEHYEVSAYDTARTMAGQAGLPQAAELLNKSLAEEEVSDNLLTQIARELMSEARTGMTKAPKRTRVAASTRQATTRLGGGGAAFGCASPCRGSGKICCAAFSKEHKTDRSRANENTAAAW